MLSASWACFKTQKKSFQDIKEYFLKLGNTLILIIKESDYIFLILHFGSFVATRDFYMISDCNENPINYHLSALGLYNFLRALDGILIWRA